MEGYISGNGGLKLDSQSVQKMKFTLGQKSWYFQHVETMASFLGSAPGLTLLTWGDFRILRMRHGLQRPSRPSRRGTPILASPLTPSLRRILAQAGPVRQLDSPGRSPFGLEEDDVVPSVLEERSG